AFSNLASSLDYYFYVKDANGCIGVAVAFAYFSRFCLYQFNMSIGDYVCGNNGSISVTETGLSTGVYTGPYLYSLDGINYQATGDFNNLSAGRYNLYTKDNSGNINIYGFNLAENCLIIIQYIAVSAACKQNDGSLAVTAANGTAPYTYTIDGINYQSSNTFNALAPGNYYITAKDANGITSSLQAAVYDRCPVVEAVSSAETCVKNDGSITAAGFKGSQPYQYSMDGVNFKTNNNFAGLVAGTYTITIRDALGFTGTVQIAVKNDCLNIYASSQPSTCGNINGSINLTVTNGTAPYQYSMDGVNFQASSTFNSLASGPYTITVKDADGLTSSIIVTVTNTVGPKINAIANSTSCLNNDGSITALNIGGTTPFQYSIDGSNFQNSGVFPGLDTGMKTLIVMDANGCNDTLKIIVPLISNLTVTAGVSISICQGTGATLNASTNGSSFTWSPSSSINNTASLKPVASPPITTKYYLTASKGICSKTDSLTIFVSPAPVANAGLDTSTCYGKNIQLQGSGGIDYLWSPVAYLDNPDISNPTVTNPVKTITFYLTVTDMNNCKSIQPASVTVKIEPPAKVFAGNDTSVIINQPLQLNAMDVNNSGFDSYVWSPASGLNDPTVQDPIALITNDIIYTVTASTPDGCEGTSSIAVKVFTISDIFVPNAFTPNGDGHNDILKAILIGIKEFKYFAIYDRWGQRVFYTKNQGLGWDGMISGQLQNTSTYVWMAGGIDFKGTVIERKGFVILIR
ncbi:MAG TPA: gliding motility-associated C-terminal domain-containing protein, partial [Puia sp.]|nr:gliding motility-associated C-terminal domain-containing protein [Puia sp.]